MGTEVDLDLKAKLRVRVSRSAWAAIGTVIAGGIAALTVFLLRGGFH